MSEHTLEVPRDVHQTLKIMTFKFDDMLPKKLSEPGALQKYVNIADDHLEEKLNVEIEHFLSTLG